MSGDSFNSMLWQVQQSAGWAFWFPFIGYGVYGLYYLYGLSAAETHVGRLIRVLLTISYTCMVFSPAFNGLGPYAFHLLGIASCLMIGQQYEHCRRLGKIKPPEAPTVLGRVVERMVEPR